MTQKIQDNEVKCENFNNSDCGEHYNCCDCGGRGGIQCCMYCFSCNACEPCYTDRYDE